MGVGLVVVTWKQWAFLIVSFFSAMFILLYDMIFPQVQIVVFSDQAEVVMLSVLEAVDEEATIRPGRAVEEEAWEVYRRPTYLVLAYGYGDLFVHRRYEYDKDWFLLHRTEDAGELIHYLKRNWNLMFWRWWLAG
ncbi:hypothetical protein FE782_22660 [Paenibacillus antri]|uniref:Uncharacterized protein n=1 Tax=Paenibacillus antri TaxID=2582848 RepID=A0A5R9G0H9_9BACL|nr:hypothetical protein [Paenibacillus antri]TLS49812.1 hypothetical protein FE782_22660 [Paenibacillus antri]